MSSLHAESTLISFSGHFDVLGLGALLLGDRVNEVAVLRRAVKGIPARFGELAENRVERRLARPERVLVAVDLDLFDARRQFRPVAAAPAASALAARPSGALLSSALASPARAALLTGLLLVVRVLRFAAAGRQRGTRRRGAPPDQAQEPAA